MPLIHKPIHAYENLKDVDDNLVFIEDNFRIVALQDPGGYCAPTHRGISSERPKMPLFDSLAVPAISMLSRNCVCSMSAASFGGVHVPTRIVPSYL